MALANRTTWEQRREEGGRIGGGEGQRGSLVGSWPIGLDGGNMLCLMFVRLHTMHRQPVTARSKWRKEGAVEDYVVPRARGELDVHGRGGRNYC